MTSSSAKLLRIAAELVGGEKELAERLGIGETLLAKFMSDMYPLPDALLLRAVDIVLADRHTRPRPFTSDSATPPAGSGD